MPETTSVAGHCPACGGSLVEYGSPPAADLSLQGERFDLRACGRCGLVRMANIDSLGDLDRFYETGTYRPGKPRLEGLARPLLQIFDRQRLAQIRRALPSGTAIADVGAGRGRFLEALRTAGYDAQGIEPSSRGYDACVERGLPVERTDIDSAGIASESLDGVVLWHVLEHLVEPSGALQEIHGWLKPGGVLFVGVPNIASLQARIGGEQWFHLDLPRHLTHFTPAALAEMLNQCGFSVEHTHHTLIEHNQLGMWQTLLNRLTPTPNFFYNLLKRNLGRFQPRYIADAAITFLVGIPLVPIAGLLELSADLMRRGGSIAVVARKSRVATENPLYDR